MKPSVDISNSQLFIAGCSVLLGFESCIITAVPPSPLSLLLLFAGTLFIYNTSRILITFNKLTGQTDSFKVTIDGRKLNIGLAVGAAILLFFMLTRLNTAGLILFAVTGLASIGYMMPFKIDGSRIKGFRNNLIIKNILLSWIWSAATVYLPLSHEIHLIPPETLVLIGFRRFFFIYALTNIYDLKDIETDNKSGFRTIAGTLGLRGTKALSMLSLVCFTVLTFWAAPEETTGITAGLLTSAVITGWVLLMAHPKKSRSYYIYWVDGTMALQALIVFLFNTIGQLSLFPK